jgi:molybdate transport system ATP-binding protein
VSLSERPEFLNVQMKHRQGVLSLEVAFALAESWTMLFGPSGSGKTTVLRAIAGLMRPEAGRIVLEGQQVFLDTRAKIFVPAYRRPVRYTAQSAALFPRMTVRENVAYGARDISSEDRDRSSAGSILEEALERFRLSALAEKYPRALSGGERQRVALVRAVTAAACLGPGTLLLLDEPFTGMDVRLRSELLEELRPWLAQREVPVLSVTHDVGEAFQLGAEVIKIEDGCVVRQGPVAEVLMEERRRVMGQFGEKTASLEA